MYDFIMQWAVKKGYSENRMLGTHIQYFYQQHPEVKAKMGPVKISEFCDGYPNLFYRHNDGKAGENVAHHLLIPCCYYLY